MTIHPQAFNAVRTFKIGACAFVCLAIAAGSVYIAARAQPGAHASVSGPVAGLESAERVAAFALLGLDPAALALVGIEPQAASEWLSASSEADAALAGVLGAGEVLRAAQLERSEARRKLAAGLMTDAQISFVASCEAQCAQAKTGFTQARSQAIEALFDVAPAGVLAKREVLIAVAGRRVGGLDSEYRVLDLDQHGFVLLSRALERRSLEAQIPQHEQTVLAIADAAASELTAARAALETGLPGMLTTFLSHAAE